MFVLYSESHQYEDMYVTALMQNGCSWSRILSSQSASVSNRIDISEPQTIRSAVGKIKHLRPVQSPRTIGDLNVRRGEADSVVSSCALRYEQVLEGLEEQTLRQQIDLKGIQYQHMLRAFLTQAIQGSSKRDVACYCRIESSSISFSSKCRRITLILPGNRDR